MRKIVTRDEIEGLCRALGNAAQGPGTIYLVGGTSAVYNRWRETTIDVDLALNPEPAGLFSAMERIKRELNLSIELASPADFVPAFPGWQGRSCFIGRFGQIDVYHFDFYTQALAKFARGHVQDLADVRSMISAGVLKNTLFWELFDQIDSLFTRFPRLNSDTVKRRALEFLTR